LKIIFVKHIHNRANSGGGWIFFVVLLSLGLFFKFFWIVAAIFYLFFLAVAPATTLSWTLMVACVLIGEQLMRIPVRYAIPLALGALVLAAVFMGRHSKRRGRSHETGRIDHDADSVGD
jgi:membrane protein implicated in regulation of membrane protease activity